MRNRTCALLLALLAAAGCGDDKQAKPSRPPEALAAMRRGTGLLEAFRYSEARTELKKAVDLAPGWTDAKVNYAIALLNMTSDESTGENLEEAAAKVVRGIVEAEPQNPHARFLLGFLLVRLGGDPDEAVGHLRRVPEPDATTMHWIGMAQMARRDTKAALKAFNAAIALDRHLSAPYYGRFTCLIRLGRDKEAQAAKAKWQKVRPAQQANLLTARAYHEIGKYAMAIRHYPKTGDPPPQRDFAWDEHPDAFAGYRSKGAQPAVAIGDVDGDGDLDVYFPGALFLNRGNLKFQRSAIPFPPQAGLFFDFDQDQVLDLFLYGARDRLWRGQGDGSFVEITEKTAGLSEKARRSRFALAADLDVDGDVDLFVTEDGAPDRILRNNRDSTFTELPLGPGTDSRGAITFDYDSDFDPDLIVAQAQGPPIRWRNDRAEGFTPDGPASLPAGTALVAGDLDRDGVEELRVVKAPLLLVDLDLDGSLEQLAPAGAVAATAANLDDGIAPEVFGLRGDRHTAFLRQARVEPGHWLLLDLRGRTAASPPQWSAPIGPGARVEVLAGGLWQLQVARSVTGFASQQPSSLTFGLGTSSRAEVVRIVWPDRVLQAELDLPANNRKVIREANRKPSSCPLLFADGPTGPRFVTDFLGSGGLGFFLERGVYGKPDKDEVVAIGPLEPIDGHYILRVLEPLEEVSYLDEATLLAVDHDPQTEVFANERFACEEPFPEFRIWEFEERVAPRRAWNDRGSEVTDRVLAVDRRYPPVVVDKRFKGFAKEHWLALDFTGRVPKMDPAEKDARLVLVLDGWVEYGYSHSNFAAAQAGCALAPPVLEVRDGDSWRSAIQNTGYPAGLPRAMTLDVTGVVTEKNPVFRLRTNLEIYWDRVTLALDHGRRRAMVHRVTPSGALLRDRGYPREYSPDGALPLLYDYSIIDPGYPFRTMAGDYTRFGEVAPLLDRADDRFVIFGKGEELVLRYPVSGLPPLPAGKQRTFFLYAVGFCKDMDRYTAHPDSIEPLPFGAMSNYPYPPGERYPDDARHTRYRREWNTRRVLR